MGEENTVSVRGAGCEISRAASLRGTHSGELVVCVLSAVQAFPSSPFKTLNSLPHPNQNRKHYSTFA